MSSSIRRLIVVLPIAAMRPLPALAKFSCVRHGNSHSSVAESGRGRGRHRSTLSREPKQRRAPQVPRGLWRGSRCFFASTSSFATRDPSFAPKYNGHPSWRPPVGDSNLFRRASPFTSPCTPRSDVDATTEGEGEAAHQIPPGTPIHEALRSSLRLLEDHSIPEPDESVLHLLSHALNLSWETGHRRLREILTLPLPSGQSASQNRLMPDLARQTLAPEQAIVFQSLLNRRLQFEPLQYIVGQWDFHHLRQLKIRKPMLCPRPETEELVELALTDIESLIRRRNVTPDGEGKIRCLDVGCGTGAIGIALARRYPEHVQVVALDVAPEAVALSNENARDLLSGSIEDEDGAAGDVGGVYRAILCSAIDFTNDPVIPAGTASATEAAPKHRMDFDVVVANPPYILARDMPGLSRDVAGHESRDALCGGADGLDVIRDIVRRLPEWTRSAATVARGEAARHCWMEVDESHPARLARWLGPGSEAVARAGVEYRRSYKDFCGRERFVLLSTVGR